MVMSMFFFGAPLGCILWRCMESSLLYFRTLYLSKACSTCGEREITWNIKGAADDSAAIDADDHDRNVCDD